jgi:hypothetical protein
MQPDAMTRLRTANPFVADPDRGKEPVAQAALQRILDTPMPSSISAPRHTMTPRALVLILAVLLVGVGGARAATDPMGWWSNSPNEAHYRVSPSIRVRTPTAQQLRCHANGNGHFNCTAASDRCYQTGQQAPSCTLSGIGLRYMKIDTIEAPPRNSILSRAGFKKAIAKALAAGTMTAADAAKFRSDLARVQDSFFTEMRLASRYGTYGVGGATRDGQTLVPPIGQPAMLACTDAARRVECQNINGDPNTPVGAGVYAAVQGPGWRWVKAPRYIGGLPPGIHFTRADYRVLIDLLRFGTTTSHSGSSGQAKPIPITHLHTAPTRTTHPK